MIMKLFGNKNNMYVTIDIPIPVAEFLWDTVLGKRFLLAEGFKEKQPSIDDFLDMRNSFKHRRWKHTPKWYIEREIEAIDCIISILADREPEYKN